MRVCQFHHGCLGIPKTCAFYGMRWIASTEKHEKPYHLSDVVGLPAALSGRSRNPRYCRGPSSLRYAEASKPARSLDPTGLERRPADDAAGAPTAARRPHPFHMPSNPAGQQTIIFRTSPDPPPRKSPTRHAKHAKSGCHGCFRVLSLFRGQIPQGCGQTVVEQPDVRRHPAHRDNSP